MPVGGDQERVEIHLIAHPDDDQTEARRLLTEQFSTFNAGKAHCFLASDREHLLAVVEAGFGDFDDFNHPPSARAAQWLKCAYDTRRVRANSTNAATTTTHSTPPHAHRTAHTTSVFQSVLQLFLGALAVHSGAQLLVIHVPRVPASDGRTSLSPAQPCGQRCVCMGGEGSPLRLRGTAAGPLTAA